MKKRLLLIVVILAVSSLLASGALFAENALVPPAGRLQTSFSGAFSFAFSRWDEGWGKEDLAEFRYYAVNAGVSLELGVNNWLAAAVQWTPGFDLWSSFYQAPVPFDKATTIGPYDLYGAVKVQLIGSEGLISSDKYRLTLSPFVKLPMWGRFFEHDSDKAMDGKYWRIEDPDRKQLAAGGRAYFDYLIGRKMYLDVFGEFLYFLGTQQEEVNWSMYELGFTGALPADTEVDYRFGTSMEVELHRELLATDRIRLGAGLPVRYAFTPEIEFGGEAIPDSATHSIFLQPNLSLQFNNTRAPTQVSVGYSLLAFGKNVDLRNAVIVSVRNQFRIYGKR